MITAEKQRVKSVLKEWHALTEVLTTPIVFHPGGWEDTLPEWFRPRVIEERIAMVNNGGWDKATDAEVTCYLYTASLAQPLGSDWTEITLFQAALQMPQLRTALPATPKELSAYQLSQLNDLKYKIRNSQIRNRKSNRKEKGMSKRKLVLEEHGSSTLVGVLQDNCDPVIKTVPGDLDQALAAIPGFLTEAQEKWAVQPKNPAYKPPATPKPAAKPAATTTPTTPKVGDLPLLAGTEPPSPAPEPSPDQTVGGIIREEAAIAPPTAEAEITEATAAPAAVEPETNTGPISVDEYEGRIERLSRQREMGLLSDEKFDERVKELRARTAAPAEIEPHPTVVAGEEKTAMSRMAEQVAPEPPAPAKPGEWEYILQDGRGPYESVQLAMDALGMDKDNRPQHNRWDRLSTAFKEKIQRRPKA